MLLYSVDFAVIEDCIRRGTWERAATYLIDKAGRLERAGAEFLLLATNTLHRVAPELEAALGIPLVHIVDVTADAARADGATTLGLLGTAPVMEADFFRVRFAARGLDVLTPPASDRELVHRVIFEELTRGVVSDAARREYLRIMTGLLNRGADGIVLGCTEISLLVSRNDLPRQPSSTPPAYTSTGPSDSASA